MYCRQVECQLRGEKDKRAGSVFRDTPVVINQSEMSYSLRRAEDDVRAEGVYRPRRMNQISFLRRGTLGFSYTASMKVSVQRLSATPKISHSRLIWLPTVSSVVVPKNVLPTNQRAQDQQLIIEYRKPNRFETHIFSLVYFTK